MGIDLSAGKDGLWEELNFGVRIIPEEETPDPNVAASQATIIKAILAVGQREGGDHPGVNVPKGHSDRNRHLKINRIEVVNDALGKLALVSGQDYTISSSKVPKSKLPNTAAYYDYQVFKIKKYNKTILVCNHHANATYIIYHLIEESELPISRDKFSQSESQSTGYFALALNHLQSAHQHTWRLCELISNYEFTYFNDVNRVRVDLVNFANTFGVNLSQLPSQIPRSAGKEIPTMTGYGEALTFKCYLDRYKISLGQNGVGLTNAELRDRLLALLKITSEAKQRLSSTFRST
jgi:hypothetical protein